MKQAIIKTYVNGQPTPLDTISYWKNSDKFTYAVVDTTDKIVVKNGFNTKLDAWKCLVQYEECEI
jgi:hypothetical protein